MRGIFYLETIILYVQIIGLKDHLEVCLPCSRLEHNNLRVPGVIILRSILVSTQDDLFFNLVSDQSLQGVQKTQYRTYYSNHISKIYSGVDQNTKSCDPFK